MENPTVVNLNEIKIESSSTDHVTPSEGSSASKTNTGSSSKIVSGTKIGYIIGGQRQYLSDNHEIISTGSLLAESLIIKVDETQQANVQTGYVSSGSASEVVKVSSSSANATVHQIANDLLSMSVSGGGGESLHAGQSSSHLSIIENSILTANNPIEFHETESLTVHGNTGLWLNRTEIVNWKGEIPITEYLINEDSNPEVIRKQTQQQLIYEQEIAVRYLRPPTPPPPGEIIIKEEKNIPIQPAPPLVIRQVPPRPETPAPLVVREAPPRPPAAIGQKVITISGKRLPPPPRKVVIERLAPLPTKPQAIMVERWLPYSQTKRKVVFQKNTVADTVIAKPKNIIVQWEAPEVQVTKNFKDLGVIRADPVEYVERYGVSLLSHSELPNFVREIQPSTNVVLASEFVGSGLIGLEGDLEALKLIDLEAEGLTEYRSYLTKISKSVSGASVNELLTETFQSIDSNKNGEISRSEAESLLLKLNIRLGRHYTQEDATAFVRVLDVNGDGVISFSEYKNELLKQFF